MAKNKNIEEIYNHLSDLDRKYTLASNKQEKERIESYTRTYADSYIDDDIYTQMSEGKASGLFARGHFLVVLKMSKWVVCIYRNRIKPFFCPLKDQSQIAQNLEAESLAAKFNYEVTYLVSTAYTEILKKESKSKLRNLRILDICFYVNNAIRKIQESLFSYPYPLSENNVSRNKIEAVMNVIYAIICELKKTQDLPESYEVEIDDVQVKYDNIIESLNRMYELDLKLFS